MDHALPATKHCPYSQRMPPNVKNSNNFENCKEILINNRIAATESEPSVIGLYSGDRFAEGIEYLKKNAKTEFLICEDYAYPMDLIARGLIRNRSCDEIIKKIPLFAHSTSADSWQIDVTDTQSKTAAIDLMERYYNSHSTLKFPLPTLSLMAEELLTNAIYRAPENLKKMNGIQREVSAQLCIWHDENRISLACLDNMGSLSRIDVLNRLTGLGEIDSQPVDAKHGGAGIRLLCANSTDVLFYSNRGQMTFAWVSFPNSGGHRRANHHRNLAVITQD